MTHRSFRPLAVGLAFGLWGLLIAGCPDDGTPAAGDSGPVDKGPGADREVPDRGPPPVAPRTDPVEVTVSEWMVSYVPTTLTSDPVRTALEQGTFAYPKAGTDSDGITWIGRVPGKDGDLGEFPLVKNGQVFQGSYYAAARVTQKAPARMFIVSGPTYSVWLGSKRRPGDPYGSRKAWVPLPSVAGDNLVVLHVVQGKGNGHAQLYTSPDELVMNEKDLVIPDLLVGDGSEQCLGVPVLNLTDGPVTDLSARIVAGGGFDATAIPLPSLGPRALTQVAFRLKPTAAFTEAKKDLKAVVELTSPTLAYAYRREITLTTVGADTMYRRSRLSLVDGSCQYYGVVPPKGLQKGQTYGLVLSLHGAGVEALGQAQSYSQKDWAYVVAATNRRPFGFDWEVWGRLDALETLDHAMATFGIDKTRVYLTGHSMGGHGTWHVGVMHPGRFATVGPSAGWSSFYTYGGSTKPTGAFARTQAHSDTNTYLSNLAKRGAFILHGGADTNVPTKEGQDMYAAMQKVTSDVKYHEEPGAGHWWDGSKAAGVDCVDWPDLFSFMKSHVLDPTELDFDFLSPGPWVSSSHSYAQILSQTDPYKDCRLVSKASGTQLSLTTTNVRGLILDGAALKKKGVTQLTVDGKSLALTDGSIPVGEQTGKKPGVHGPFNEVMVRPFCFVYPDSGGEAWAEVAAYLASTFAVIGNGQACAMPHKQLKTQEPVGVNLIFLGFLPSAIDGATPAVSWTESAITVGTSSFSDAVLFTVFPRKGRLAGAIAATKGMNYLIYRIPIFTSRVVLPDYFVYSASGTKAAGFFDATWAFDPTLNK